MTRPLHQRGAALLLAMLTVALVATLSAAALWQHWRGVEIETAERARAQLAWVLVGALDWSRLILREDGRAGEVDHLSEPWALPLSEARLSTFLAQDREHEPPDVAEAFLSGQVSDQQARLNVTNLAAQGSSDEPFYLAFAKLFRLLGLPLSELGLLADQLRLSNQQTPTAAQAPLRPLQLDDLRRFGLTPPTLAALAPYITVLPEPTPVNLNTASAEVLCAILPGVDLVQAQQLVAKRTTAHFRTVAEALRAAAVPDGWVDAQRVSVSTRYFEVVGRLRIERALTQERSLILRQALVTQVLWRQREVVRVDVAPSPSF